MEKQSITFYLGNDIEEVIFPKYLYPNVREDESINYQFAREQYGEYTFRQTSYYPVRSKEGDIHYIKIMNTSMEIVPIKYDNDEIQRIKNNFRREFYNEVIKFIHFNNYHTKTNEEINNIMSLV